MRPVIFPPKCEKYVDLQCNGDKTLYTDMPEVKHIDALLHDIRPKVVLDVGAGIGRASVYFHHRYNWKDTLFYLLDGDGGETQYDELRSKDGEYYNSFECAQTFCEANELNYRQVDANGEWEELITEPIDLVYSFLAIGFHWPLFFYLSRLYDILNPGTILIFGTRNRDKEKWVRKQLSSIDGKQYVLVDAFIDERRTRSSVIILKRK